MIMRIVRNLVDGTEYWFDGATTPEHALAQVHYEALGLSSWYFNHYPNYAEAHKSLKFHYGEQSVGLGNYATVNTRTPLVKD